MDTQLYIVLTLSQIVQLNTNYT